MVVINTPAPTHNACDASSSRLFMLALMLLTAREASSKLIRFTETWVELHTYKPAAL